MQIIPDPMFTLIMILPFAVSLIALNVLLFKPVRAYLEGREHAMIGARHEAEQLAADTEAKMAELERRLAAAREEATRLHTERRAAAIAREAEVLDAARRAAEAELDAALSTIATEATAARQSIRETAASLSGEVASQVLGRPVEA
ncbi:MAG: ATP synthase F0 subunit B [Alphaproteobacteria bacterium]|nr:ATP synthase F0 subunit B [Alphaproteobacteria bacterium]